MVDGIIGILFNYGIDRTVEPEFVVMGISIDVFVDSYFFRINISSINS